MSRVVRIGNDPDPRGTQEAMLRAIVNHGGSMTRLECERAAFGHTTFKANWSIDAMRALKEAGFVERPNGYTRYRATQLGVDHVYLLDQYGDLSQRHPSNGGGAA